MGLDVGFVRLDVGFVRLDVGFVRLDVGFVRLDGGFVRLGMGFVRLDVGFVCLEMCRRRSFASSVPLHHLSGVFCSPSRQSRVKKPIKPMKTTTCPLECFFNRINDSDGTWIGFRRLKPSQDEDMSPRTVMVLSAFYAPACALLVATLLIPLWGELGVRGIFIASIAAGVGFVLSQSLSAVFWNQRASTLRAEPDSL